jgi:sodium-dependent dicarboxylate transporter 2/3/5
MTARLPSTIAGIVVAGSLLAGLRYADYSWTVAVASALAGLAGVWWIVVSLPPTTKFWSILAGVLVGTAVYVAMVEENATPQQCWTAAVTGLCTTWWLFEALPLAVTSLIPLVAFPLTGVLTTAQVSAAYGDPYIWLFMGGFILSRAVEHWGAHRRIAQFTVLCVGGSSGRSVVFGVMLATMLVSMWISNVATTLMMLPVAMAFLERDRSGKLAVPLLLGVAYSSSIGGIATPVGTAPNGVFMAVYKNTTGHTVPFHQWMMLGVPIALLMLVAAWLVLTFRLGKVESIRFSTEEKWTAAQRRSLAVFGLVCLAWLTREIPFGGWTEWFNVGFSHDMLVAVVGAIALFLIPSGDADGGYLMNWEIAERIPWGVLILFGGGIAIATAFDSSGLSKLLGSEFEHLESWPTLAIIATLCFSITFISEFTSNTAAANILMPMLAAMAKTSGLDPALLMIPATFSNSLSFMMPVGTPPNAVVYGTGHIRMGHMVRAGFVLNIIGAIIVTLFCWMFLPYVFDRP